MTADLGILTRNYDEHLAGQVGSPDALTFYSEVRWRRAHDALLDGKSVVVYFVAGGDGLHVTYAATLVDVDLAPDANSARTQAMLTRAPDGAAMQAVIAGEAKTVYTVTGVVAVDPPLAQSELIKASDHTPVSHAYLRAYAVVHPHE